MLKWGSKITFETTRSRIATVGLLMTKVAILNCMHNCTFYAHDTVGLSVVRYGASAATEMVDD